MHIKVITQASKELLFPLGQVVATPGALDALRERADYLVQLLARHAAGDWGVVGDEDQRANDTALREGTRLLSAYPIDPAKPSRGHGDNTLWIITESDRSVTTILLPEEY